MAEVIGLIASTMTIAAVVLEGGQVEELSFLIEEIRRQDVSSTSAVVATTLHKAKLALEKLNGLIQAKLIKNIHDTSRARRRVWARNKSKVKRIQIELQGHRSNLIALMSALSTSSAIRSEAMLESISHNISHSKQISLDLDQHLLEIKQAITRTHNPVLSQYITGNCPLQTISFNPAHHLTSLEQHAPLPLVSSQRHEMVAVDINSDPRREQLIPTKGTDCPREVPKERYECKFTTVISIKVLWALIILKASILGPASPFEKSFPETYSIDQRLPIYSLVIISSYEYVSSLECRTNICQVYLQKAPRKWCRLILSLQVHKSSIYWAAMKVSRKQVQIKQITTSSRSLQLPYTLQKRIQATLSRTRDCAEDSDLKCHIINQDPVQVENDGSYDNFSLGTNSNFQNPMAFLNDLGCDQYLEDEVVQVQMLDPPGRFASCINGTMVYEVRLYNSKPTAELLYNIELLHRMKGTSGLARLVGIVTDTSRKNLQGYLIELPRARWRLDRIALDPSVSWSRRRKWAKQLIESIAHLHSQGLVAGMISAYRMPVILDDSDCVHFWYFRNTLAIGRTRGGYYPPEHQYLRNVCPTMTEVHCPKFTSKTDIFHIGLMLWTLASQRYLSQSLVCTKSDCQKGNFCHNESHSNPIALHPLPRAIPQYYKDVMNSCMAENPEDRPTARELLSKFPAESIQSDQFGQLNVGYPFRHDDALARARGILQTVTCDRCNKDHIQEVNFFHCNACEYGDFDLCQQCYDNGEHCYDKNHFLIELEGANCVAVSGKYHASPNDCGDHFEEIREALSKIVECKFLSYAETTT
ncbi:MAG: hypothetical protein Q9214_002976 [Letrouitia sp. 1 TL-2023]